VPQWYWWLLAGGWLGLGFLVDLDNAWATAAATLAFGALHAAIAPRILTGTPARPGAAMEAGRRDVTLFVTVLVTLVVLVVATVVMGALASADGADHPATMASFVVAAALVCAGPRLAPNDHGPA
jgi:hypothetical protein